MCLLLFKDGILCYFHSEFLDRLNLVNYVIFVLFLLFMVFKSKLTLYVSIGKSTQILLKYIHVCVYCSQDTVHDELNKWGWTKMTAKFKNVKFHKSNFLFWKMNIKAILGKDNCLAITMKRQQSWISISQIVVALSTATHAKKLFGFKSYWGSLSTNKRIFLRLWQYLAHCMASYIT